jgi:hypothetical protein
MSFEIDIKITYFTIHSLSANNRVVEDFSPVYKAIQEVHQNFSRPYFELDPLHTLAQNCGTYTKIPVI